MNTSNLPIIHPQDGLINSYIFLSIQSKVHNANMTLNEQGYLFVRINHWLVSMTRQHSNEKLCFKRTFVFLLSPPVDNVFEAIKQSGLGSEGRGTSSCDVSHRLFLSHKRCSDPSEQVPRERAADHRGTFTHLQLQWEELKACPLRMRAAQQKGHTHIHILAQRQTVIAILHRATHTYIYPHKDRRWSLFYTCIHTGRKITWRNVSQLLAYPQICGLEVK